MKLPQLALRDLFWIVLICSMAGCTPAGKLPLPSPDGSLTVHTSIESSHSDPTAYGCVVIEIHDKSGKILHRENSHASYFHKWDISWTSNDELKLMSSDIGDRTWIRQPDGTWRIKEN